MLGPLQVRRSGRTVALRGAQRARLLALLAVEPGTTVAVDALVEALWSTPPPTAVKTVRVQVRALRQVLEPDPAAPTVLVTRPGGYAVELAPHQVDLHRFNALVRHGRELLDAGHAARAADRFREALELWCDPPLPDLADVAEHAPTIAQATSRALAAREGVLLSLLELGRHRELLAQVEPLLVAEPLREELHALALLAHHHEGEQAAALAVAARARQVLRDELGVEPGPRLQRLEQAVLAQEPPPDERATPEVRTSSSAFVGRGAELVVLGDLWRSAAAGHGSLVLLAGDPGLGKTRLARELAEQVRAAGGRVGWARCAGSGAPFGPVRSWLSQLQGAADPGGTGTTADGTAPQLDVDAGAHQRSVERLLHALVQGAEAGPLLLVLDDLHDADHATADLLLELAPRLEGRPLLVVATMRAAEVDHTPALVSVLPGLSGDDHVSRLDLRPLGREETGRYLDLVLGAHDEELDEAVWHRAAGNVLFTVELADHLRARDGDPTAVQDLPDGLRVHLRRVLDRLGPDAAAVVDAMAVLGDGAAPDTIAALVGEGVDVARGQAEVAARRLVQEGDQATWRFSHDLVLDAVYDAIEPRRRTTLHRLAADQLARRAAPDAGEVQELARHRHRALPADAPACVAACTAAAAHAASDAAFDDAARWSAVALEACSHLAEHDPATRRTTLQHGEMLLRAGRTEDARRHLDRAATLARAAGDPEALATAASLLVADRVAGPAEDPAGFALLQEADAALGDRDDELKVRILDRLSLALVQQDLDASERLAQEALARAERNGRDHVLALAHNGMAMAAAGPDAAPRRLAHASDAVQAARRAADPESVLVGRLLRVLTLLELGRAAEADAELVLVVAGADERREPRYRWMAEGWCGLQALRTGCFDEAERRFVAAFEVWDGRPTGDAVLALGVQTIGLRLLQGRAEEVLAIVDGGAAEAGPSPTWCAVRALAFATAGAHDEATTALDACLAMSPPRWPIDATWAVGVSAATEAAALLGHEDGCEALLPLLLASTDRHAVLTAFGAGGSYWGCLAHPAGLAAATLGRSAQARDLLAVARAEHERVGALPFAARSAAALAEV